MARVGFSARPKFIHTAFDEAARDGGIGVRAVMRIEEGRKYRSRNGRVVGPLKRGGEGMEDHWQFLGRSWHRDGTCCGDRDFDLVSEAEQ